MNNEYVAPVLSELEELECIYCEMHKDVYGVKARWYRAESVEQARADLERLSAAAELEAIREREEQNAAAVRFEQRVADTIALGAGDRETALRWIHDAEETGGDPEYLCYVAGLRYGYFKAEAA
jgi:hypothetical protein